MVKTATFLQKIAEIAKEKPSYRHGGSARDGTCDCIGLIIGALRRAGFTWPGTHGSNWAARYSVTDLHKVKAGETLAPGTIVFKYKAKGQSGWNLPSRYRNGKDLNDYYHVGVVTQSSPIIITHCTTPTVKQDTKLGTWAYAGNLKYISENPPEPEPLPTPPYQAKVIGGNLNLRAGASTSAKKIRQFANGTELTVTENLDGWSKVEYKLTGYVMSKYLEADKK